MSRRMNPLCIDLYAGLGGWGSAFAQEGYVCYDWICHIKLRRYRKDSFVMLKKPNPVGCGPAVSQDLDTVDLWSKRAYRQIWPIGYRTGFLWEKFLPGCRYCIAAMCQHVSIQNTCLSERRLITCATRLVRGVGNILRAISLEIRIQTPFSPTFRLGDSWPISRVARGH